MKRFSLLLAGILAASFAQAQTPCVPGTITGSGNGYIIPDSATNFAHACPGTYYEQILYIKAPKDTAIAVSIPTPPISGTITANIDSFVFDANILNLPSYLTLESTPAALPPAGAGSPKSNFVRLVVPGDSLACVKISGNVPSTETAQTYNLSAALRVYLSNMHSVNAILEAFIPSMYPGRKTDTVINLNYYKIIVYPTPCWPTGIVSQTAPRFQMTDVSPNPATTLCRISFESDKKAITDIQWFNALGESVYSTSIPAQQGMNYLLVPTATLPNGLYYCTLSQGAHKISTRISVLNN